MKLFLLLLLITFSVKSVFADSFSKNTVPLTISHGKIYRNGIDLNKDQIRMYMSYHPQSLDVYNQSRSLKTIGYIISIPSSFMTGYELGGMISNKKEKSNYTTFFIYTAGMIVGTYCIHRAKIRYHESVDIYNQSIRAKASPTADIKIGLTGSGPGLVMAF